jgi:hypothetical protein
VLAAIEREPRASADWRGVRDPLPWWAHILTERATVLSGMVAGAMVAFAPALSRAGRELPGWLGGLGRELALRFDAWLVPQPLRIALSGPQPGLDVAFLVGAMLLAYPLYRLGIGISQRAGTVPQGR